MSRPVRQFVERRSVIRTRVFEGVFGREVDAVALSVVERAVCLIMSDSGTATAENAFACFYNFEWFRWFGGMRWDAVNLACIEDGVDAVNQTVFRLVVCLWFIRRINPEPRSLRYLAIAGRRGFF